MIRTNTNLSGDRRRRGVTMFVVAIGVFALGVAVAIAVPAIQKSQRKARAVATAGQLREFAQLLQAQAKKRGDWPPGARAGGQVPSGMENTMTASWTRRTPIGGRYLWAPDALQRGQRYRATIVLYSLANDPVSEDSRVLEEIDRALDDGDLHTGNFQLGYRDQPFLVIEP